jgi:hypothetical protein
MRSEATTTQEYLDELPRDRAEALSVVLAALRASLPKGLEENMNWGMVTFEVPLAIYPKTYNGQPLMHTAVANQKKHMAIYMSCLYGEGQGRDEFVEAYKATGKRMDLGKGCLRFRKLDDLPLDLITEYSGRLTIERLCAIHDETTANRK